MKRALILITAILTTWQSFAQLEVIDTNNITRERWRDSVLRIDMSQVPTGFLLEYSMFGLESDKYDGVGNNDDTIKTDGRIFELHNILWYSKVNNNASIDLTDSLFSRAFFANLDNGVIPLTFIYQNYNRIRQSSLSEGLFAITPDSVGIVDVAGRQTRLTITMSYLPLLHSKQKLQGLMLFHLRCQMNCFICRATTMWKLILMMERAFEIYQKAAQ